jgi:XrtN system VIT domain protein
LQDLKGSDFAEHLKTYLQAPPRLHTFNLSAEKSDYIRTLKELRAFIYDEGSPEKLAILLQKHQFLKDPEDATSVALTESQVKITATTNQGQVAGTAPNHLLRLFAYNNIMKKISPNYFKPDANSPELILEAATANVVSPVSSLVVLETQQDYKRFDITKSKDSLGNATAKAAGSVPEPHEWLLIALAVITVGYLLGKPYLKSRLA